MLQVVGISDTIPVPCRLVYTYDVFSYEKSGYVWLVCGYLLLPRVQQYHTFRTNDGFKPDMEQNSRLARA